MTRPSTPLAVLAPGTQLVLNAPPRKKCMGTYAVLQELPTRFQMICRAPPTANHLHKTLEQAWHKPRTITQRMTHLSYSPLWSGIVRRAA